MIEVDEKQGGPVSDWEEDRRRAKAWFESWDRDFFRRTHSFNRLPTFLDDCRHYAPTLEAMGGELFWAMFYEVWNACDATWQYRHEVLGLLREHRDYCHEFGDFFGIVDHWDNPNEVAFNESLPDRIRVYRGCSREQVRSLAWTTDYDVAWRFARGHRGAKTPDPVIAECVVPLHIVLATFAGREESEVILDFKRLPKKIILHPFEQEKAAA